jgi:hypothetical protein
LSDPRLAGRLDIQLTIQPDGHVGQVSTSPQLNSTTETAAEFQQCVQRNLRGRTLPSPIGGEVRFAFSLGLVPGQQPR